MKSRRQFLQTGALGALGLMGGGLTLSRVVTVAEVRPNPLGDAGRPPRSGRGLKEIRLTARPVSWEVGPSGPASAWGYNGRVPGPEIRVREGEILRVTLTNELPEPTTIHWHGLPVPHAMDGVPELTQEPVPPGDTYVYEFLAGPAGTYWYHSHAAPYQFDRGLFGPLVIEPAHEDLVYDREHVLVFDDWLLDPEDPEPDRSAGMGMMGMMRGRTRDGMEASPQPLYDAFTINGLTGEAQAPLEVREGDRIRLRLINASASHVVPFHLAGHRLLVTHSDGQPIRPIEADMLRIGMGERYDVLVEARNPGVWRLGSLDRAQRERGLWLPVRYRGVRGTEVSDAASSRLSSFSYRDLDGVDTVAVDEPDRSYDLQLSGGMMMGPTVWTINGRQYPDTEPLDVREGERVRLRLLNMSMMPHPMHLHGHFFDLVGPDGQAAASPIRKDTLMLGHMQTHVVDFTADNPGARWFFHCHNVYHQHGGMATEVRYRG